MFFAKRREGLMERTVSYGKGILHKYAFEDRLKVIVKMLNLLISFTVEK